jgi:MYXO-CTERM domain-containing protein
MRRSYPRPILAMGLAAAALALAPTVRAEPSEPVLIGWWSYFAPEGDANKVPTTTNPNHVVDHFGDPDTYYYEPSGGHGMQEDPSVLPPEQAWQNLVSYILAHADQFSLASEFTRNEGSDINKFQEAYFGWAFAMLYVPREMYCDDYKVHIGTVDDGVQAMANGKILGYANLGDHDVSIDMVQYGTSELVLRPGINEIVLIHQDQCAVQRYVTGVYITHNGVQVPLAPKNILWGQVTDQSTAKPIYKADLLLSGSSTDTFTTGPFGFYFFAGLADGTFDITAKAGGYIGASAQGAVALGQAATEAVRVDFALQPGCNCPDGTQCGSGGECLEPCVPGGGEFQFTCPNPGEVCVSGYCVKDLCDTILCAPGMTCENGTCVEVACSNVCCEPGQVCSGGACVADQCGNGCNTGYACFGGQCVDACSVLTCVNGLLCKEGKCLPACDVDPSRCGAMGDGGTTLYDSGLFGDAGYVQDGGGGSNTGHGAPGGTATDGSSGGCGCRLASGDSGRPPIPILAAGLAAALAASQRRRRR